MTKPFILLLLLLTGCASLNTVHADQPMISGCFKEQFTDGVIETPDYLQLATQACTIDVEARVTHVLQFPHKVQAADLQMGSNAGSKFEWAFWVDFVTPSGRQLSLFNQYDKHEDSVGNRHEWRSFSVPLELPAGTSVTVRRPAQSVDACVTAGPWSTGQACATGQKIELVGVIQ